MSLCRGRLFLPTHRERRSQESGLVQALNFADSDGEMDSSINDASMESVSPTDVGDNRSPGRWPRNITNTTPISSPSGHRKIAVVSPIPYKCDDSDDDQFPDENNPVCRLPPIPASPMSPALTPPHKRLKSLRLYDTPHTPKSLLQKAQRRMCRPRNKFNLTDVSESTPSPRLPLDPLKPQANVNPFTPNNNNNSALSCSGSTGQKRPRNGFDGSLFDDSVDDSMDEETPSTKKLALHEINTFRYNEEFYEVCKLGDGEFGSVYRCIHRLDGCTYAIKKSKRPVAGSVYERTAVNEVYAHSVLGQHPHVVRYYSAWAENDHMFIQNEYCNGGSLAEMLLQYRQSSKQMTEAELKTLLLQIALGLKYVHSMNLVHLDIKPGNIFLCCNQQLSPGAGSIDEVEPLVFKIGDLGHVTLTTSPQVEEGDCRYLPAEILQENWNHLAKADIFSLALTVFEAATLCDMPKNGDDWHQIREGNLPYISHLSEEFNNLLKSMVRPDPRDRPSASSLVQSTVLCPFEDKSRDQLRQELNHEKFKNEILQRQLQEAAKRTKFAVPQMLSNGRESRLVGRKVNRSMSLT